MTYNRRNIKSPCLFYYDKGFFMDSTKALIVYDGDCTLCNRTVKLLKKADKKGRFEYCSIKKAMSHELLPTHLALQLTGDEVALWHNQQLHLGHKAVTKILILLQGYYALIGHISTLLPSVLKRWIYQLVAKHRKRLGASLPYC